MSIPETNPSLIVRLRDSADERSWFEFVEIYRPAIVRLASHKGLQPADCDDIAQKVFASVAGAIERWRPDGSRARFRTWLFTIANRHMIDELRRQSVRPMPSNSEGQARMDDLAERQADSRILRLELRRQVFHRVASAMRGEFTESMWQSFWLMAVEGCSAEETSRRVGKTVGAVYAAKARVMRRLVERIRDYGDGLQEIED